jgi:L-iditol 2-dehydrogenase
MRAAVVREPKVLEVADFPMPEAIAPGQVVVKMHRASVCGSDVHLVCDGLMEESGLGVPGFPGHEGVGEVIDSASDQFAVGDFVLTVPIPYAGGTYAQYLLTTDAALVALPSDGNLDQLLMAQQYGTTLFAMRLFWPEAGNTGGTDLCAIIGAGSAGLFFLQQAKSMGFQHVLISDPIRERREVAQTLGADTVIDPTRESFTERVNQLTEHRGADLVIEAAGYDTCRADAIAAVKAHGTVGFFGQPESLEYGSFPHYRAFRKAARIQWVSGTQNEPGLRSFRKAVEHIHSGLIDVGYCNGPVFDLEDVAEAIEHARNPKGNSIKVSIGFPGDA